MNDVASTKPALSVQDKLTLRLVTETIGGICDLLLTKGDSEFVSVVATPNLDDLGPRFPLTIDISVTNPESIGRIVGKERNYLRSMALLLRGMLPMYRVTLRVWDQTGGRFVCTIRADTALTDQYPARKPN